jgi:IclR family acetate operon transcriptional repressor
MIKVPAAERTLKVFEAFQRVRRPMSLSEIAEHIDAPISSCHDLVEVLLDQGYLFRLESHRLLYPTRKVLDLAGGIAASDPIIASVSPHAEWLRDSTGEAVLVSKRQGSFAQYLLAFEGVPTYTSIVQPGDFTNLHSCASGKALLGTMDPKRLMRWVETSRLKKVTEETITDRSKLLLDLQSGREQGFFETRGENMPGVSALAMAHRLCDETLAIAVAGPTDRIRSERRKIIRALGSVMDMLRQAVVATR